MSGAFRFPARYDIIRAASARQREPAGERPIYRDCKQALCLRIGDGSAVVFGHVITHPFDPQIEGKPAFGIHLLR